ncbi:hypothetical protein [Erythrobacter sp.]|uniref:hypothetical protein n=1 Tax=Erythrobacter sp. TaxID=1042 RepID=UPI0025BE06A8|nr:hypothetical protein [Erythrobacter sp.]
MAIVILLYAFRMRSGAFTILSCLLTLGIFLLTSYQNKRELLFVIFLIGLIASSHTKLGLNLNLKAIFLGIAAIFLSVVVIVAASISRGYGGYHVSSPVDALRYTGEYIDSPYFVQFFLENIEAVHTYPASVLAIDMAVRGDVPYQFGATFLKVLFLPISRDWISFKPESALQLFTQRVSPEGWAAGHSLPVPLPAEAFLNFHAVGLLILPIFFLVFDRFFLTALVSIRGAEKFVGLAMIGVVILSLIVVRGGGLELLVITIAMALPALLLPKVRFVRRKLRVRLAGQEVRYQPDV